ncbi:MAG: transcriptional repressor [Elusimicrobia bacterium]|nr:transcriptional repressor [Elusimicrobiota bacterium]
MPKKELIFFPTWTAGRKGYAERIRQFFQQHLEKKRLRLTHQRAQILDLLLQADRHLSQEEIYRTLKKYGIGRVTVFRTLKLLEECQLLTEVTTPRGQPRFEIHMERPHHDHLICIECGHILEIRWPELERIQERSCRKVGFLPAWHRHEIFGRCAECVR